MNHSENLDTSLLDTIREQKIGKSKIEAVIPLDNKKVLELDEIIRLGTLYVEDFKIEDGQIIKIRPLSIAEKNKAMYRGLLEIANTKTLNKVWGNMDQAGEIERELTTEDQLNLLLFTEEENAWQVMLAIKDFHKEITEIIEKYGENKAVQIIKRDINDLGKLALRIKEISGLTESSHETVDAFQEDVSRLGNTLRTESNRPRPENINTKSDLPSKNISRTEPINTKEGNE